LQNTPEEITVRVPFDEIGADAWFRGGGHERDVMALELLERDQVLASVMPGHGQPPLPGDPGGEQAPPDPDGDGEPEGDPS
jgi:hypothetical protein